MLHTVKKAFDGENTRPPDGNTTCPFSEGCKLHHSPGQILRYSVVICLSVFLFLFLFVISLFFPKVVPAPNLKEVRELVGILLQLIPGFRDTPTG